MRRQMRADEPCGEPFHMERCLSPSWLLRKGRPRVGGLDGALASERGGKMAKRNQGRTGGGALGSESDWLRLK